jgi:hypothetical protein
MVDVSERRTASRRIVRASGPFGPGTLEIRIFTSLGFQTRKSFRSGLFNPRSLFLRRRLVREWVVVMRSMDTGGFMCVLHLNRLRYRFTPGIGYG